MAGRGAAAGQADAFRRQDLARQGGRQEAGEPAGAGAQGERPAHAAVDGGDAFLQPHHSRQRQLGATEGARRQHAQPAAPVQQRLLDRVQPAGRIGGGGVAGNATGIAFKQKGCRHRVLALEKKKPASRKRAFDILLLLIGTEFWLPDLDSNQGPAD
jgi:hypothetical protein